MVDATAATTHITPIRIYYEDTDAGGIVYHSNYLKYAERARTEMMRDLSDGHYAGMLADGMAFIVRRCTVDYAGAAKLDDLVEVHSRVVHVGGASISAEQIVRRAGEQLVGMEIKLGCVDGGGRPARIPADLRAVIEKYA